MLFSVTFALIGSTMAQDKPDRAWLEGVRKPSPPERAARAGPRAFPTLDAYLAHLREHAAPIDLPWYSEVRPDVFKLETGNLRTGAEPRYFTREELERRFGFRR